MSVLARYMLDRTNVSTVVVRYPFFCGIGVGEEWYGQAVACYNVTIQVNGALDLECLIMK